MKIVQIDTLQLKAYPNLLYVRVFTDEGIVGLGETYFNAETVAAWIHETAALYLLGKNPLNIEQHWQGLNPFIGFRSTGVENRGRSAIDVALWDILGKVTGQPLYQLLGGKCRDAIRVYNTCAGYQYVQHRPRHGNLPTDNWGVAAPGTARPYEDLEGFLHRADELAQSLVAEGFSGMKIWPFDLYAEMTGGHYIQRDDLKKALEPFEKIRKAVGDRIDIMVELHSLWDVTTAKQLARALEPFDPAWYEDPVKMDNLDALKSFHDFTRVPTTASETLGTRWSFRELLEKQAADIVMFDPTWVGGVSESKKICTLAEAYQKPIAPHDCQGPVEFAVAVHISINAPNTYIQEVVRAFFTGWYPELVTDVPVVKDGYVRPLEGPGVGTDLRPEVFKRVDLMVRSSREPSSTRRVL